MTAVPDDVPLVQLQDSQACGCGCVPLEYHNGTNTEWDGARNDDPCWCCPSNGAPPNLQSTRTAFASVVAHIVVGVLTILADVFNIILIMTTTNTHWFTAHSAGMGVVGGLLYLLTGLLLLFICRASATGQTHDIRCVVRVSLVLSIIEVAYGLVQMATYVASIMYAMKYSKNDQSLNSNDNLMIIAYVTLSATVVMSGIIAAGCGLVWMKHLVSQRVFSFCVCAAPEVSTVDNNPYIITGSNMMTPPPYNLTDMARPPPYHQDGDITGSPCHQDGHITRSPYHQDGDITGSPHHQDPPPPPYSETDDRTVKDK